MKNLINNQERINFLLQEFNKLNFKRYSSKPLPSYRHIPGMTPHPVSDVNGHSYNKPKEKIIQISENNWRNNEIFLYAIDLFNFKYFWEAHETLEDLWKIEKPDSLMKLFLQGIIQISAAYLQWIRSIYGGVNKLNTNGNEKLMKVQDSKTIMCGIDLSRLIIENQEFLKNNLDKNAFPPIIKLIDL